jgi:putative Mg2+ transporter-C (MgtC) family protein
MIGASLSTWGAQILYLSVALALSTAIGFERQLRSKSAGMRTHALVGLGAALFMIVSKYGFDDVLVSGLIRVDPSRVAAQVVSGIGFIGAGLVFVRRNKVRGLTTAASIWMVAAVGSAAGAGLIIPAVFVTVAHFFVAYVYPFVVGHTRLGRVADHTVQVQYATETGALRLILLACTDLGFAIVGFVTSSARESMVGARHAEGALGSALGGKSAEVVDESLVGSTVEVELELNGTSPVPLLVRRLSELENVRGVSVDDEP